MRRMRNWLVPSLVAIAMAAAAPGWDPTDASAAVAYPSALAGPPDEADERIARLQLMLKKLRATLASLKEVDELARAGLPREDAQAIREASEAKIHQLTADILLTLQQL